MKIIYNTVLVFLLTLVFCTSSVQAETDTTSQNDTIIETTDDNKNEENAEQPDASVEEMIEESNTLEPVMVSRPQLVENPNRTIEGHQLIAQNNALELYLEEESLSIIIRDKKTSAVMYSTINQPDEKNNDTWKNFMKSGITMEYLTGTNVNVNKAGMFTPNTSKEVNKTDQGFEANIFFNDLEIGFTFSVELTETGLIAQVKEDSIVEGTQHKVSGFNFYPFLGYSELGDREGYMVIPDGSGAIINLEDNDGEYTQPYSNWIYGQNIGLDEKNIPTLFKGHNIVTPSENILMPIFGMVHTDSKIGVLGIVEGGAQYSSKIEAYPNGAMTNYDWITAKMVYRQSYNQSTSKSSGTIVVVQNEKNHFDARIRYEFVSGDDATYTGLAKRYRDYLQQHDELNKMEESFNIRLDFLGMDQKEGLFSKEDVVMTTVEDIERIYNELSDVGISQILSIYKGWQKGGISTGLPNMNYETDKVLGGNNNLTKLLDELEDTDINLYLYNDPLRLNADSTSMLKYSIIKKLNKRVFEEETYKEVVGRYYYLLPSKTSQLLDGMKKDYIKHDIKQIMITGITNNLFSYSVKGKVSDRIETAEAYETMIRTLTESMDTLLEQPFAYLWKYTNQFIDAPLTGSKYNFTDEDIPFLSIVLKGSMPMYSEYINFEANKTEYFLRLVEQGILPSFYLTMEDPANLKYTNSSDIYSSRYDLYKEDIVSYYESLKSVYDHIEGATIENHKKIDDVAIVEYSNGVKVYVNYGLKSKTVDGVTIDAQSYKVGGVS